MKKELCIITVLGKDQVGIVYHISKFLHESKINIEDISQKIMATNFVMLMMIDIAQSDSNMAEIKKEMDSIGQKMGINITIQHTDVLEKMHRI